MADDKSSWKHLLGVLGFGLSLCSLGWQVFIYQDSLAEKALVRLSSRQEFTLSKDEDFPATMSSGGKGHLQAEVVNMGQHPLYVKSVELTAPCPSDHSEATIFQPDGKTDAPLQPGAATTYHITDWNFSAHPLDNPIDPAKKETYCVTVNSNKGALSQSSPAIIHSYDIRDFVSLRPGIRREQRR